MIQYGMEYYGTVRNNTVLGKIICVFTFSDDICFGNVFFRKKTLRECQHVVPVFSTKIKVSHKHQDFTSYYVFFVFSVILFSLGHFLGGFDPPEATDLTHPGF